MEKRFLLSKKGNDLPIKGAKFIRGSRGSLQPLPRKPIPPSFETLNSLSSHITRYTSTRKPSIFHPHTYRSTDKEREEALVVRKYDALRVFKSIDSMIPPELRVNLVYAQGQSLSISASPIYQIFRANSVYDPDQTGTGGQPNGFDELATLYTMYRVESCKFEAFTVSQSASSLPLTAVALPMNVTTVLTGVTDAIGNPHCRYAPVSTADRGFAKKLEVKVNIRNFLGVTKSMFGGDDYSAAINNNPSRQVYIHYYVQDMQEGGGTIACTSLFKITYSVMFYSRVPLNTS